MDLIVLNAGTLKTLDYDIYLYPKSLLIFPIALGWFYNVRAFTDFFSFWRGMDSFVEGLCNPLRITELFYYFIFLSADLFTEYVLRAFSVLSDLQ